MLVIAIVKVVICLVLICLLSHFIYLNALQLKAFKKRDKLQIKIDKGTSESQLEAGILLQMRHK